MAESLPAVFRAQAARRAGETALIEYGGRSMTWQGWAEAADACAAALLEAGHRPGERIAVFAGNVLLWPIADIAVQALGMTSVGVFPTAAPAQVAEVLADAAATAVFVDAPDRLAAVLSARGSLPALRTVVADCDTGDAAVRPWPSWLAMGARLRAPRYPECGLDDDAIIIHTSGSTGTPKGARISHRYLLASAESLVHTLGFRAGERSLSYLPFSHAAERVFGHARRIVSGDTALLIDDHRLLWDAAAGFRPTVFGGLPRFYEKLYELLQERRGQLGTGEAALWDRGLELGRERSALRRAGQPVPAVLEATWSDAVAQQRAVLEGCLGPDVRIATSGGAALPRHVAEALDACGLTVLGAYGLTEHLCVASHRPDSYDFAGVGPAMHGTALRIADDGEILVQRGDLTFSGYLGREEETQALFTADGVWLRTGDLGRVDDQGVLHVTGRSKELIALSTGKKVAPVRIEARLTQHPWISQAMLYGEGRKYVTALLVLRRAAVEAWARAQGSAAPYDELLCSAEVRARIGEAIDAVNADLSSPEKVRRFVLLERELSAAEGEITDTMKLRRAVVADHFRDRLDALYEEVRV
jgi:long-chain acyl-CoA synthetase